jgi:hypothetical protein
MSLKKPFPKSLPGTDKFVGFEGAFGVVDDGMYTTNNGIQSAIFLYKILLQFAVYNG